MSTDKTTSKFFGKSVAPSSDQNAVPPTLAVFPERPDKEQMLECLSLAIDDAVTVYEAVRDGDDSMLLSAESLLVLLRAHTRLTAARGGLGTLAVIEAQRLAAWGPK